MTEYVKREDAVKAAECAFDAWNLAMSQADRKREINLIFKRQELCKAVESVFRNAPTANVKPYVTGAWIKDEMSYDFEEDVNCIYYDWRCSNCGCTVNDKYDLPKYCQDCGAEMREESYFEEQF